MSTAHDSSRRSTARSQNRFDHCAQYGWAITFPPTGVPCGATATRPGGNPTYDYVYAHSSLLARVEVRDHSLGEAEIVG